MAERIALEFERGGVVLADLLTGEAPRTCEAVLEALPVRQKAVHAMWAGEEIFFDGFPLTEPLAFENETNDVEPGSVAVISSYATRRYRSELITSFCVFYGKSRPRKGLDQTVDVNVFARITDSAAMREIARRIRYEGAEGLLVRRADPAGESR